jgi:hypothetical protein
VITFITNRVVSVGQALKVEGEKMWLNLRAWRGGGKMRIIALVIGIILVTASVGLAADAPVQAGPAVTPEVVDGFPYTGIIKNKTRYAVSIPSDNSDATVIIPPYSWIEYTIWTHKYDVAAYHNGEPFYCLKLVAHPQEYTFKCKKYDFIAEIVKAEPGWKSKKLRKRVRYYNYKKSET